jgi:hypothetical protein
MRRVGTKIAVPNAEEVAQDLPSELGSLWLIDWSWGVCGECGIRIWHIAKLVLATFRRFLDGPCACLLSSEGKTALRG